MSRRDIKLVFDAPQYTIAENNNAVICHLTCKIEAPEALKYGYECYNLYPLERTVYKGVAIAKDNDAFDVNVGKKVALAKAENQAYRRFANYLSRFYKTLNDAADAIKAFDAKSKKVVNHNISYMRKF